MNFTREPIIETVITPREGCHLAIRSSKGTNQEDYLVEAVEVVSFGHSFFFRSQERPGSFLVPVSDYEVLELKETRMVLKNAPIDRSIKIGGGRDAAPPRVQREHTESESADSKEELEGNPSFSEQRKRDNKRRRGRRGGNRPDQNQPMESRPAPSPDEAPSPSSENLEEAPKAPSFISKLFPPPTTLIKETLSRYKFTESEENSSLLEEKLEEPSLDNPASFDIPPDSEEDTPQED